MVNFHRECWNPVKKHLKALVFFAVSKQIPIIYSADRGRAENRSMKTLFFIRVLQRLFDLQISTDNFERMNFGENCIPKLY